ncbi:MAG: DUF302 domain-containing protein [Gammaproteobacteria bacterium]|jgi:uncharacterized protein (DUF302 family)
MKIGSLLAGIVIGGVIVAVAGWFTMPGMMLHEKRSPYTVEETVEKIKSNAENAGWVVADIKPLHKSVKKHGGGDLPAVMLMNLCQANHAYNILQEDGNKILSVMMPCTISVYQKSDGNTYVGTMNAELLGKMFGGTIAKIMGEEVAADQQGFISFLN